MSQFKFIKYVEENSTAVISMNRPELYNALNAEAKMEVVIAIRDANKNKAIKSIILTGEGKAFSTGQDLNDRNIQATSGGVDLGHTLQTEWNPLVNAIRDSKKIIIGAINGVCAGAGISVAIACDILVSKSSVKFVGAFSKLGLAPDAGSTYIFTRALGYHKTMEFFLLGEALTSDELYEAGLINALAVDPMEKAQEYAQAINKLSPLSCELIKKNIKASQDLNYSDSMERETSVQRFLGNSADYKEGLSAFLSKRQPLFTGQ